MIPSAHVDDGEKNMTISLDVPGFNEDTVKVFLEDLDTLVVSGERTNKAGNKVAFSRRYTLNGDRFDLDSIKGSLSDGVLEVTVAKKEAPKSRKIVITSDDTKPTDTTGTTVEATLSE